MKNKKFMSVFFLIILAVIAVGVRTFYINSMMAEVNINEDIYNAAKVSSGNGGLMSVFDNGVNMQSIYICSLNAAFMIFGNFTVSGVYLNVLYQVITVLLVYIIVRNLSDRYIGFAAGFIAAILPAYVRSLSDVAVLNMEIFIAAVICAIVAFVGRFFYNKFYAKYKNKQQKKDIKTIQRQETVPGMAAVLPEPEMAPVRDTSLKEIVLDELEDKKEEMAEEKAGDKKINYIENPLPVPKRREHKEMDFAFEPSGGEDDYDLKDMTGKDFYDIE